MAKRLDGLTWRPAWITGLGCLKGCLEYLESDISWGWLYGATGHAFVINIHEVLCPSGPTAFNGGMIFADLAANAGISTDHVLGFKNAPDFAAKQAEAWEFARKAIDDGTPCFAWEVDIPEYYVINGYDDTGYLYSGCTAGDDKPAKPWGEFADTGIGVLNVYSVRLGEAADDAKTVRDACGFGAKFGTDPGGWVFEAYRSGGAAFKRWADALESGAASTDGHGYNARCWGECRSHAVEFLREAKERLGGRCDGAFDEAIEHYGTVASALEKVNEMRPWHGPADGFESKLTDPESAGILRGAGEAEAKALAALAKVAEGL